jgi:hypothetical protein
MAYIPAKIPSSTKTTGRPVPARVALKGAEAAWGKFIKGRFDKVNDEVYNALIRIPSVDAAGNYSQDYCFMRQTGHIAATSTPWNSDVEEGWADMEKCRVSLYRYSAAVNYDTGLNNFAHREQNMQAQLSAAADGIKTLINDMIIRGNANAPKNNKDPTQGNGCFDGLLKIADDTKQIYNEPVDLTCLDVRNSSNMDIIAKDHTADIVNTIAAIARSMNPRPTFIIGNPAALSALSAVAKQYGRYQIVPNQWGSDIPDFFGLAMINCGRRAYDYRLDTIQTEVIKDKLSRESIMDNKISTCQTSLILGSSSEEAIFGISAPNDNIITDSRKSGDHNVKWILDYYYGLGCAGTNCLRVLNNVYVPNTLRLATKDIEL